MYRAGLGWLGRKPSHGDKLLNLDLGACRLDLLLDFLGFRLRHRFLDRLRSGFHQNPSPLSGQGR